MENKAKKNFIKVKTKDGIVTVGFKPLESIKDIDKVMKTDVTNILGELAFFPVIMNKIGVIYVEAEDNLAKAKMEFYIWTAEVEDEFRAKKSKLGEKAPTVKEQENHVLTHKDYRKKRRTYDIAKKKHRTLEILYWNAKSKQSNLDKLSLSIKPDQESMEKVVESIEDLYGAYVLRVKKRKLLISDDED